MLTNQLIHYGTLDILKVDCVLSSNGLLAWKPVIVNTHQLKQRIDGVLGARVLAAVRDQVLGGLLAVHVLLVVHEPCGKQMKLPSLPRTSSCMVFYSKPLKNSKDDN